MNQTRMLAAVGSLLSLGIVACTATTRANSQTSTDPKEILIAADKAGAALKSVRYTTTSDFMGQTVKAQIVEIRADVPGGGKSVKTKYAVSLEYEGNTVRYAYDGKALRLRDGDNSDVQIIEYPSDTQLGQALGRYPMGDMPLFGGHFESWAKVGQLAYKGPKTVGKWQCDLIEIKRKVEHPSDGEMTITSYIAFDRASHLPVQSGLYPDKMKTITELELNPPVDEATFALAGKEVKTNVRESLAANLLPVGTSAPAFSLKDASGRTRSLSEFKGKVVLLDFWATWCAPCLKMLPKLESFHKKYKDKDLVVLGISIANHENADPAALMKKMGLTYGLLLEGDPAGAAYKAKLLPTLYLIGKDGRIAYRQAGLSTDDDAELIKLIEQLTKR